MRRLWTAKPFLVAYVVVVAFLVGLLVNRAPVEEPAIAVSGQPFNRWTPSHQLEREIAETPLPLQIFRPTPVTARMLLRMGLPLWARPNAGATQNRQGLLIYGTGRGLSRQPQSLLEIILPFLARQGEIARPEPPRNLVTRPDPEQPPQPAEPTPTEPKIPEPSAPKGEPKAPAEVLAAKPLIGIYHTHDWESYISEHPKLKIKTESDLMYVRSLNPDKNILRIGGTLARRLAELGIASAQNPRSHEEAGYDYAYTASRKTARQILSEHSTVKILLDLHRDAVPRNLAVTTINGKQVARIQIVIGTGRPDLPHPNWKQNEAFAKLLHAEMERRYPGLSRGILIKQDRYNQDLTPGALLLEFGSATNNMSEAEESARLFAEVLHAVVKRNTFPQ